MGGFSPQQEAAGQIQQQNSENQIRLLNQSLPALQQVLAAFGSDLSGPGGEPASVAKFFSNTRNAVGTNYQQAELSSSNAIATSAKSMGLDYRPDAITAAQTTAKQTLEQRKAASLQDLSMEEATFGLNATEALLGRMGRIESMLAAASTGYGSAALGAAGSLPNTTPGGAALGGASAGAGIGNSIYPGWGALIGGAIGGAYGYASGGG